MPKQITAPAIIIELVEDPEIAEFLNHQKKSTRNTYTSFDFSAFLLIYLITRRVVSQLSEVVSKLQEA